MGGGSSILARFILGAHFILSLPPGLPPSRLVVLPTSIWALLLLDCRTLECRLIQDRMVPVIEDSKAEGAPVGVGYFRFTQSVSSDTSTNHSSSVMICSSAQHTASNSVPAFGMGITAMTLSFASNILATHIVVILKSWKFNLNLKESNSGPRSRNS